MATRGARRTIDWGHLSVLTTVGGAVLWYLADAISVSTNIHNLLLVAPLCIVALAMCLIIAPQCFRKDVVISEAAHQEGVNNAGAEGLRSMDHKNLLVIGSVGAALGIYVFILNVVGFDIATWLFALAVMFVCGERRPFFLMIYPLVVTVLLISAFRALLPFPMYTAIL